MLSGGNYDHGDVLEGGVPCQPLRTATGLVEVLDVISWGTPSCSNPFRHPKAADACGLDPKPSIALAERLGSSSLAIAA